LINLGGVCFAQVAAQPSEQHQTEPSDSRSGDEAAIRADAKAFVEAFNRADAQAVAELWTENGEYVDEPGTRSAGREEIQKKYAEFFAAQPGAKIHVAIDSLRMLGDTTAIEEGRAFLDPAPAGTPGFSKYTAIHVKQDGKWRMASVRDSWVDTPSTHQYIADLGWLIGTWNSEEQGVKTESIGAWVADKSFVERKYTTTHVDGTKSSGVQIIGWNAERGHIQSWNFGSDGGFAVGVWMPNQGGWTARMIGITGEGIPTSAVNVLTRLDDNAYAWQSVQRSAGGQVLPDTGEVILKRPTATH
jgi:uncharacterized protein (TIGR02246 family)